MPHQMQQLSDIDQHNSISSENVLKDSGMDSSSESVSSDNSQRQQALEMRHQELLKKQKQLQEQYQRLQQMSKNSIPLATPGVCEEKKNCRDPNFPPRMRSNVNDSVKNMPDDNDPDNVDVSSTPNGNINIDKNGDLNGGAGTASNLTKTTNKVYETDIL